MTQSELYHHCRENNICVLCHKEKTQLSALCDKCKEKKRMAGKDDYRWYKEHGICTSCHKEKSIPGQTLCLVCWEKSFEKNNLYYEKNKEEVKARSRVNAKKRYETLKSQGLCVKCGSHKAVSGHTLCISCRAKKLMKKDKRYNNDIERCERNSFGLCYICAAPLSRYSRLCDACQERNVKLIGKLNDNPTQAWSCG